MHTIVIVIVAIVLVAASFAAFFFVGRKALAKCDALSVERAAAARQARMNRYSMSDLHPVRKGEFS